MESESRGEEEIILRKGRKEYKSGDLNQASTLEVLHPCQTGYAACVTSDSHA
jgi:hypothetical protein